MGPNGAGKSYVFIGFIYNPAFTVTEGSVTDLYGKDLLALPPEDRSREGVL